MSKSTQPDQRHLNRAKLMQQLFATTFDDQLTSKGSESDLQSSGQTSESEQPFKLPYDSSSVAEADKIIQHLAQIDELLQQHAPERPLEGINQVDLAILRVIVWESMTKKTPKKVLIDEAVELAKEFGSEASPRFVNGVLGKLLLIGNEDNNK